MTTSTLILSGFGTNCEKETAYACRRAGRVATGGEVSVDIRHINALYNEGVALEDYGLLILIGGFLDGDDLGSGKACANRFRHRRLPSGGTFLDALERFIGAGRLVLGICNGFQVMVKLGLLPGLEGSSDHPPRVTLTTNANGRFEDRWVSLKADPASPCVFTRGIGRIELPVRHGEGRLLAGEAALVGGLLERHLAPLAYSLPEGGPTEAYPHNPNGSPRGIAALCNPAGTVLGMMPHPEAFNYYTNHPQWSRRPPPADAEAEDGEGLRLFRNAYAYLHGPCG
ncbi:MAG: phosphoribosylformylglycinamidine synthase subunit PurQ [Candidatus Lambdaproteobacteria bacterium]|nr:phosphoribosylformylglycinamidine synthase subunit PurQ [Candidatus Lambdaproteobacteria bacterium]